MDPIIRIRGLVRKFGDFEAVKRIDLDVDPGQVFVLLGPNGAGKTTIIRILMGILQPTAGEARIRGLSCGTDRAEIMRHVGYVPDDPVFHDYLRGRELLHFVAQMHGLTRTEAADRVKVLLERLDLSDAADEYAMNYSRGMKRKLAIACALLHEPELLILDEPTSGLDPFATRTVHTIIRSQAEAGKSVFLSTHLLDQAERLCTHVGILHKGRLAASGRLDDLRAQASQHSTLEEIFFSVAKEPGTGAGEDASS